jgi:hypothetical protein
VNAAKEYDSHSHLTHIQLRKEPPERVPDLYRVTIGKAEFQRIRKSGEHMAWLKWAGLAMRTYETASQVDAHSLRDSVQARFGFAPTVECIQGGLRPLKRPWLAKLGLVTDRGTVGMFETLDAALAAGLAAFKDERQEAGLPPIKPVVTVYGVLEIEQVHVLNGG